MDIRKIKKLIELLEESDVEELEIQEGDDSVRISRRREPAAGGHYVSHYAAPAPPRPLPPRLRHPRLMPPPRLRNPRLRQPPPLATP